MQNKIEMTSPLKCCLSAIPLLCCLANTSLTAQTAEPETLLLRNLHVIVGDGTVIENASVLIRDGIIASVDVSSATDQAADIASIDLQGKTLMPVLIDAHAHLGYENYERWGSANYSIENLLDHLNRYAWYGFGAVFSAGSDPDTLAFQVQKMQQEGAINTARLVFAAGMAPPGQGPNNQFLAEALTLEQTTGTAILHGLANPGQAQQAVREVASRGVSFIKIWVDDRGGSQTKLVPDIYRAAIAEARLHGIAVLAHQQTASDMPELIDAGVRGFLHGRLENGFTPAIAEAARRNNVFIVPNLGLAELRAEAIGLDPFLALTLPPTAVQRLSLSTTRLATPDRNPQLESTLRQSFSTMQAAGTSIVLGTDAGAVPDHPFGYSGHRELEIFVRHGMSPMQALMSATSRAAEALALHDTGQIRVGLRADLLILDANPLNDIRNTRAIYRVYLAGKAVAR